MNGAKWKDAGPEIYDTDFDQFVNIIYSKPGLICCPWACITLLVILLCRRMMEQNPFHYLLLVNSVVHDFSCLTFLLRWRAAYMNLHKASATRHLSVLKKSLDLRMKNTHHKLQRHEVIIDVMYFLYTTFKSKNWT